MAAVQPPEQFSFDSPDKWEVWLRRFQRYRLVSELHNKPGETQVDMLVYSMGPKAEDIMAKFPQQARVIYDTAIENFTKHFATACTQYSNYVDISANREKFKKCIKKPNQTPGEYKEELEVLWKTCGYPIHLKNETFYAQFAAGFCCEPSDSKPNVNQLDCDNCGFPHGSKKCPALHTVCAICNVRGHYARKCPRKNRGRKPAPHKQQQNPIFPTQAVLQQNLIPQLLLQQNLLQPQPLMQHSFLQSPQQQQQGFLQSSQQQQQANGPGFNMFSNSSNCGFCGGNQHPRSQCPASNAVCLTCEKKGHFAGMCLNKNLSQASANGFQRRQLGRSCSQQDVSNLNDGCNNCGGKRHQNLSACPANNRQCGYCKRSGHVTKCCPVLRKKKENGPYATPASSVFDSDEGSTYDGDTEEERNITLLGNAGPFGFNIAPVLDPGEYTLQAVDVERNSQGYMEGLREGDFIIEIDNTDVSTMAPAAARHMVFNTPPPHSLVVCTNRQAKARPQKQPKPVVVPEMKKPRKRNTKKVQAAVDDDDDLADDPEVFELFQLVKGLFAMLPKASRQKAAAEMIDVFDKYMVDNKPDEAAAATGPKSYEFYQELLNLHDQQIIPNRDGFECAVCMCETTAGEGIILQECLHTYCKDCLVQLVQTSDDVEIKCPYRGDDNEICDTIFTQVEIKAFTPDDIFEKYMERCLILAENGSPDSFHCRTPDCRGWCIMEPQADKFRCPICLHENCLSCKAIHEDMSCQAFEQFGDDAQQNPENIRAISDLLDSNQAMRCPTCKAIVIKDGGCDAVDCKMCKTAICWATKGPRWGPAGKGDTSGGCRCGVNGVRCHQNCAYCH